ncbi:S1 RNA-binding domain-containing protein 1 [Culicoides brevitarsis]|uniref:S1 RNA-binding domain-containing protein 1 n=1 Tax=Culicoides brevitarsis TaxID=469753 RepID=UPI00307B9D05
MGNIISAVKTAIEGPEPRARSTTTATKVQKPKVPKIHVTKHDRVAAWVNESVSPERVLAPKIHDTGEISSYLNDKYGKRPWSKHELLAVLENLPLSQAHSICQLFDEDNSIPFLCRYRRDLIGPEIDAERLRDIKNTYNQILAIRAKAESVIKKLESKNVLTPEIKVELLCAKTLDQVDHLYEPYKERKNSAYEKAVELGLEVHAVNMLRGRGPPMKFETFVNQSNESLSTTKKVEDFFKSVIVHDIAKNPEVLDQLRDLQLTHKIELTSTVVKKKESKDANSKGKNKDQDHKFENYFDFKQNIAYLKPHQILAINRGENLKILSVKVVPSDYVKRDLLRFTRDLYMKSGTHYILRTNMFDIAFEEAWNKKLLPLVQRQVRSNLTTTAEQQSIKVFASNLKQLLLMAPVKGEPILGIDPGFSNGCKMALISERGDVLETFTLYPFTKNDRQSEEHALKMASAMNRHNCKLIALGNGTACRETETWITNLKSKGVLRSDVRYCIVSEQGASIYSCSETAKKEFPDVDINIISAISIARRLNDPLCEFVKVDPKSLGVGMYQHDINAKVLSETLDEVVIECVSFTGVDINTASVALLKHVAGLTEKRANQILEYRAKNGPFKARQDVKKVNLIGPKTFEQCAGFIRIDPATAGIRKDQYCVLDSTTVHPESYEIAEKIIRECQMTVSDIGTPKFIKAIKGYAKSLDPQTFSKKYGVPYERLVTVFESLEKELFHDFRMDVNNKPLFKSGLTKMTDLKENTVVSGAVTNICDFGVFVDIGVECNGLIHQSKMNGMKVKIGDKVEATVLSIDANRNRIGLALKSIL